MWECPDLFCLDGRWYLLVSPPGHPARTSMAAAISPWKAIGAPRTAPQDSFTLWTAGFDFLRPQTFADEPHSRRILLGWMGMPDAPMATKATVNCGWQHCMTLPRVLTRRADGRLLQQPARSFWRCGKNTVLSPGQAHLLPSARFALQAPVNGSFVLHIAQGAELHYTQPDRRCVLRFYRPGALRRTHPAGSPAGRCLPQPGCGGCLPRWRSSLNQGDAVFSTRYYPAQGRWPSGWTEPPHPYTN